MNTQVNSPSLDQQVDDLIALIDIQIGQCESMLDQLKQQQDQLDYIARKIKADQAIAGDKVILDQSPDGDFYMDSFTDPNTMYEVSWFSCSCPDHVYRRKTCKHIIAFRSLSSNRLAKLEAEAMQARADLGL